MAYFPVTSEFGLEVSKGNLANTSYVHKFGSNPAISSGTSEDIWDSTVSLYPYQSAAQGLEAVSDSANDDVAGTGALTIMVYGLDASWDEQSETVIMTGAVPVALANTYIRVFRAKVLTAGSGSVNDGNITIRLTGAGVTQAYIAADAGQTLMAIYTIPNGVTAYMMGWYASVVKFTSAAADISLLVREGADTAAPTWQTKELLTAHSNSGPFHAEFAFPAEYPGKTDIRVHADVSTAAVGVAAGFDLLLES